MTTDVDDFLEHYGVKGMKWGVRKDKDSYNTRRKARLEDLKTRPTTSFTVETKFGETVDVREVQPFATANYIASLSDKGTQKLKDYTAFELYVDGNEDPIGESEFAKKSEGEVNLIWLGVNPEQRGKGYGSAVFDAAVKHGNDTGAKKLTLEVPTTAKDAQHIYKKQGFVVTKEPTSKEIEKDVVWGGLIHMELDLTKKALKHGDVDEDSDELEKAFALTFTPELKAVMSGEATHEDLDDFFAHYGVKGMKWGVRKDRGSGKLEKRETKASKHEAKAATLTKENAALRAENSGANMRRKRAIRKQLISNSKAIRTAELDAANAREGKLSSRQKKLLVGGAIVGTLIVAYGARNMQQSGEFNRMMTKGKRALEGGDGELFKKNESYANKNYSADQIMKNVVPGINPNYGSWGTNMNCRRATFAYEMRRRGYEVEATKTSNASGQNTVGLLNALSPGEKERNTGMIGAMKLLKNDPETMQRMQVFPAGGKQRIKRNDKGGYSGKSILDTLSKEPSGSRGEFATMWKSAVPGIPGGGHSMAYEVVNGKAHIFDAQTGKQYKANDPIFKSIDDAGYTRLDNVKLNTNYLAKWVK